MLSPEAYAIAARHLCELVWSVKERFGKMVQYIDLGGGFPSTNTLKGAYLPGTDTVPSIDQFADAITDVILGYGFRQEELPTLILETGRALIDDAGYLLGTVLATKRLSMDDALRLWIWFEFLVYFTLVRAQDKSSTKTWRSNGRNGHVWSTLYEY